MSSQAESRITRLNTLQLSGVAILLATLCLIFLAPILFPNPGTAPGGGDVRGLFIPWFATARAAVAQGDLPLWDPYQFGGYPFLSNPQVAFFYPPTWIAFILPVATGISWFLALHLWLTALGTFFFLRNYGADPVPALLGALSLTFSYFTAARVYAGHIGVIATFAWLPWLLLAYRWALRDDGLGRAIIAGVPFALAILAGHSTSLLYVSLIWIAVVVYHFLQGDRRSALTRFLVAALVGVGISGIQLLPFLQFAVASSRSASASFAFATDYSWPPAHLITLLVPEFFGEPTVLGYWSVPVFEEMAYYAGVLALIGIILALARPRALTWLFVALALGGLILAFGRYGFLYQYLYDIFPPLRLARAPARAAYLTTFAGSALLSLGLTTWRRTGDRERLARILRGTAIVAGIAILAALAATGAVFAARHPDETSGRLWHQIGGWSWLLLLLLVASALTWGFISQPRGRRRTLLAALLVMLVVGDLWHYGTKLIRLEPLQTTTLWSTARDLIGTGEERVLPWGVSIFEQNGAGEVGLRSIFGYNALVLSATERLTSSVPDPRSTAYDLFSVRYVLAGVPLDNFTDGARGLRLAAQEGGTWIYERARVMPVVRLVEEVEVISDDEAAIARIHAPDFDPGRTVILPQSPECLGDAVASDGAGEATLLVHDPASWEIATNSATPAILVVSEAAYPGWRVTIDGQPATPLRAYTAIRAVCVPAGKHAVTWTFQARTLWLGGTLTLLSLAAVILSALRLRRRGSRNTDEASSR